MTIYNATREFPIFETKNRITQIIKQSGTLKYTIDARSRFDLGNFEQLRERHDS